MSSVALKRASWWVAGAAAGISIAAGLLELSVSVPVSRLEIAWTLARVVIQL